jgi:hypothetical protein
MKKISKVLFLIWFTGFSRVAFPIDDYAQVSADGRAAVATVNPHATHIAMEVIARGGNAIDAAIAAAFTLGVVDGHNSGIGGGCFILVRMADGRILRGESGKRKMHDSCNFRFPCPVLMEIVGHRHRRSHVDNPRRRNLHRYDLVDVLQPTIQQ